MTRRKYIPTPKHNQGLTQGQFSSGVLQVWMQRLEFSLPYYLPVAGRKIVRCVPFLMVSAPSEMQTDSSRIWTRVVVSISYNNNPYNKSASMKTF